MRAEKGGVRRQDALSDLITMCREIIVDGVEVWHGFLRESAGEMRLEVECYSGRKADERPVRFRLDGHEYLVEEVLDQWYGPADTYFKVQANDGKLYILRRETVAPEGAWHLEPFRQLPRRKS